MTEKYSPRIADSELKDRLKASGAVVIEGPKACGKTATARKISESEVLFDVDQNARQAVEVDPRLVLAGATPRLLDEWQIVPEVWNYVRREVDERSESGQFVLTGSAVPADDVVRHTGAGRISRLKMRPMSLFESGVSTGGISLRAIAAGEKVQAPATELGIDRLASEIVRGGWPGFRGLDDDDAARAVRDYIDEIRRTDISRIDGRRRDPEKVGLLLRSLARNNSTYASARTLAADVGGEDGGIRDDTVREYLDALTRLFVVEDQPAWSPNLRSKATLRSGAKRQFVDPSLAAAAIGVGAAGLVRDLNLMGFMFESLVIRDLRVYAQAAGAEVLQYRDSSGREVDAILRWPDGRWAIFEIKLGPGQVNAASDSIDSFMKAIDLESTGPPVVRAVIVGDGFGYTREDGLAVIPIAALGP